MDLILTYFHLTIFFEKKKISAGYLLKTKYSGGHIISSWHELFLAFQGNHQNFDLKSIEISHSLWDSKDGKKFDDYTGFQLKITHAN